MRILRASHFLLVPLIALANCKNGKPPTNDAASATSKREIAAAKLTEILWSGPGHSKEEFITQHHRMIDAQVKAELANRTPLSMQEKLYPGLLKAMFESELPIRLEIRALKNQKIKEEFTKLYAQELTLDEITKISDFYVSPAGEKLINQMAENRSYDNFSKDIALRNAASASSIVKDMAVTGEAARTELTKEEDEIVRAFAETGPGKAVVRIGPKVVALRMRWINYLPPGFDEKLRQAAEKARMDYMVDLDRKRATWWAR